MSHSESHSVANPMTPHHTEVGHHGHQGLHVHVMPLSMLFTIFGALIFFTIATVVISKFHLGAWEVPITMAIATTKAALVAVYFMHLRYDNPFHAIVFCFSLLFVALFLGGTLIDVREYQPDLIPFTAPAAPAAAPAP
ncbi:cytochrome C oxidase subunit IV family protein [Schlesneria sp.]|uniref:cytochrome C oxidase subunit IV family protein n=1 Tax=Schlesneria sp. TaxID=2762018 RepID=UPI002F054AB7